MGELDYENRLKLRPHDFEVLEQFDFEYAPVGFKFFNVEDELEGLGLERLDATMSWCQMLREAQGGRSLYATIENHKCEPGIFLTGHGPLTPLAASGRIGPAFDIYPDERANRRVYNHVSMLAEGSTFATGFAPVKALTFDPDVLVIACNNMEQGETIVRATQWDTGDVISSLMTYVMGCNWLFTYPYVTGNINMIWTGICHGMSGYQLHPPGLPIVSIPWHHIDRVLRNLREIPGRQPTDLAERESLRRRGHERLGVDGVI